MVGSPGKHFDHIFNSLQDSRGFIAMAIQNLQIAGIKDLCLKMNIQIMGIEDLWLKMNVQIMGIKKDLCLKRGNVPFLSRLWLQS